MIEQLTNWYVRMNKERLAGERGADDRSSSLCTLYEVLLMLCRMMAPLTPFFTELAYRNLRHAMPDGTALDSVHFDMIPEADESAIDTKVEADMKVMQQVIERGRGIRDRHNLSMRTPLPEVTLVHREASAVDAIKRLEQYVKEELNVRSVSAHLVSEVPKLVRFKCLPNHKLLGARFGKDYKKVQDEIKALGHEQLAAFMASGKMTLSGNEFGPEDIVVSLEYAGDTSERDAEVMEEGAGLVLLDRKPDEGMLAEAMAREVCAKVQKLRKECGLQKADEVEVGFAVDRADSTLARVLEAKRDYVATRIGKPLIPVAKLPPLHVPLGSKSEEVKIQSLVDGAITSVTETLEITLCRGCAFFHAAKLSKLLPDATLADGAAALVSCKDLSSLKAELAASGGTLRFKLDGKDVTLRQGEHFFLNSVEAAKAGAL